MSRVADLKEGFALREEPSALKLMDFRDDEQVRWAKAFNVPYADSERSIWFCRDFGIGYRAWRSFVHGV